ncbi:hypothetical protein LZP85_05700 [Priestia flexa]|jgi:hypothetical protein|uniref:Uncharacterized protein n=1 Tax=Priestia flexa TaxID=86664 RepID=A0A1N6XHJ2_9BACI|nr:MULTISPECIES: hypothetical protein [Bacillaceae]MBN8252409.1 hypothetical protein [Priestia flexa]MBN8433879.1 hypothetical protein [Priestia flexa]MBY6087695.1 hypothetical protein [Priestia flexa]MCA0966409.1 hypothetical protein [Priestia flexa]MCA1201476.1 hypothetical protein [Priestia flexa]
MSRGKHFNHKKQGHEPTVSQAGQPVTPKHTQKVDYVINTVGTEDDPAVSIHVQKDND